jgi:cobalamin biosynthesis protein CobD/CbiB
MCGLLATTNKMPAQYSSWIVSGLLICIIIIFPSNFIIWFLAKKSVFFPAVELLEFVCDLVQMDANQLQHNWQTYFDQIHQQLKGVF